MVDVFISFKNSFQGEPTRDQAMAKALYNSLKAENISVFFSNNTLSEQGISEYKNSIDAALTDAKILVLVGTNKDFITSKWVQYEWNTFMQEILSERKTDGKIFTYLEDMPIYDLPIGLRSLQSFSTHQNSLENIVSYIKNSLGTHAGECVKGELCDGIFAYYGINQKIDYKKAFDILMQYPDDATALYLLARIYYYGDLAEKDLKKAIELYTKAYEKGSTIAGYKLAESHKRGVGVDINFPKHDEIKMKLAVDYSALLKTINKTDFEYTNNLVFIGKTNKNHITKEAVLAIEIRNVLSLLGIEVELFDVDIGNEEKVKRIDEIHDERNMFIFSSLRNVNDNRMEIIWKSMFVKYELSAKLAVTHISEIQIHDIPSYLRKTPFIVRDATSMSKIASFFMRGK